MSSAYNDALKCIKISLLDPQLEEYPLQNWLIYKLNFFIWAIVGKNSNNDRWYYLNEGNMYRLWLKIVVDKLKETFYDATPTRTFKCAINCPHEDVAKIIFDATPVYIVKAFFDDLNSDEYKNYYYTIN